MTAPRLTLTLVDPDDTAHHAAVLAGGLRPGDVILLTGDVGAGKTHFARALIKTLLLSPEDVPSPTFTLVQTYETKLGEIWHADLYRLTSTLEIEELGLIDAFDTAICLVEWPDRLGDLTPSSALSICLDAGLTPDLRLLSANWRDDRWTERLAVWQAS